jgi:hypothetical protein
MKLSAIIAAAFIMVIAISGEVFAEGEIPPEPSEEIEVNETTTGEETAPAVEETTQEVTSTESPTEVEGEIVTEPTPKPPVEEITSIEEQPTVESTTDEGAIVDESVTTETEVTVELLDTTGEPMDMASQASAETAASGDPWFKVGTTTYRFFNELNGCNAYPGEVGITCFDDLGTDVIQDALDYIANNALLPSDKKLYVEAGTYEGFAIDNTNIYWPQLTGIIGAGSGLTFLDSSVWIEDTLKGFTLSGFTIQNTGQLYMGNNTGTLKMQDIVVTGSTGTGIYVSDHTGNVEVTEVDVSGSAGGLRIGTNGNVKITNSSFRENVDYGIRIAGADIKAVTIDGVIANNNNDFGIRLIGFTSLTVKNSIMNNNGDENNAFFGGYGFNAQSDLVANVNLDHVYANGNFYGIHIETLGNLAVRYTEASNNVNPYVDEFGDGFIFYGGGTAKIEFSHFNDNNRIGLQVDTGKTITLNSVRAERNGGQGAILDNYDGSGGVTVTSPAGGGWLQANYFNDNVDNGLYIYSKGAVVVNNADFGGNNDTGLYIPESASVTIGVTIPNWVNGIWWNDGYGVDINSNGTVTISKTSADENFESGFNIRTNGAVKLTQVNATNNGAYGADILNHTAITAQNVQLIDCTFNENDGGHGVKIWTKGSVVASGLSASNNLTDGLFIDASWGTGGVSIQPSKNTYDTLFNNNGANGLNFWVNGSIVLNGISASDNGWDGVHIERPTTAPVTIQNMRTDGFSSNFNDNDGSGIFVITRGAITLMNLNAMGNDLEGAHLDNCVYDAGISGCLGSGNVTINASSGKGNQFNGNGGHGLLVQSRGIIKLVNADACDNGWTGALLQNNFSNSAAGVIITTVGGWRNFYDNNNQGDHDDQAGLWVVSHGTVSLSKAQANNNLNQAYGIYLNNQWSIGSKTVTVTDIYTLGNDNDGLHVAGSGAITVTGIESTDNFGDGASLTNFGAVANITVTSSLTRPINIFERNVNGLTIMDTAGSVTLQDIRARENGMDGVWVDNTAGQGAVTVRSVNAITRMNNNGWSGLYILSNGNVALSGGKNWIFADFNSQDEWVGDMDGIFIDNSTAISPKTVTLSNVRTKGNKDSGIEILSSGTVTITSVYVVENKNGLWIENHLGSGGVTLLGSNTASGNTEWGVVIYTDGAVSVSGLTAENNNKSGIFAQSYSSGTMTISNSFFRYNGMHGMQLVSDGNFLLTNVISIQNGDAYNADGISIDAGFLSTVTMKYSVFMDNRGNGIEIMHPGTSFTPLLLACSWFGNDTDGSGNLNLWVGTTGEP